MATNQNQSAPGVPFTISGTRRVVDIDAVDDVAGYAKVNGREVAVHHLDAAAYRAVRQLFENPGAFDVLALYDAAERACPELSRDEIDLMSGVKIGRLLMVAEQSIKDVEAQIPNAPRPTEQATTEPTTSSPPA